MRNYGQHNALLCGIRAARHEVIVTMDDDLQHPPEQIPVLLKKLQEGFDVVYATPEKMKHDVFRNVSSKVTKWVMRTALGAITAPDISAFRAFHTIIRDAFDRFEGPRVSIDVLLTWGAARFATVEVKHESRAYGKSNYNFRRLLSHTLNMVTGFSILPLRVASFIGFFFHHFRIWCALFCDISLFFVREQRSWLSFSSLHHFNLLRGPAFCLRINW